MGHTVCMYVIDQKWAHVFIDNMQGQNEHNDLKHAK